MRLPDPFGTPPPEDALETRATGPTVLWETSADKDNARDASEFLGMYKKKKNADRIIDDLIAGDLTTFKAKDILRAACLPPQPLDNAHVQIAMQLIAAGIHSPPYTYSEANSKAACQSLLLMVTTAYRPPSGPTPVWM